MEIASAAIEAPMLPAMPVCGNGLVAIGPLVPDTTPIGVTLFPPRQTLGL